MNTRKIILAFLAQRYPAAYTADVITQRINSSGYLDTPTTADAVLRELRTLTTKHQHVDLMVDDYGVQHWGATNAGVRAWALEGSLSIGG